MRSAATPTAAAWAAAVVVAVAISGCRSAPPRPDDPRFGDAETAFLAGDWGRAAVLFSECAAATEDPATQATCHFWTGVSRRRSGDVDGARAALRKALASPDGAIQARSRLQLGDLAFADSEWPAAHEMYRGAIAGFGHLVAPDAVRARLGAALAAVRGGDRTTGTAAMRSLLDDGYGLGDSPVAMGYSRSELRLAVERATETDGFVTVFGPVRSPAAAERLVGLATGSGAGATIVTSPAGPPGDETVGVLYYVLGEAHQSWDAAAEELARWRALGEQARIMP